MPVSHESMKVLVTGGAGFIGSHLVRHCVSEGHRVWVVDDLSTGSEENIPQEAIFLKLDIADDQIEDQLPREDFDAVFHLAAQSSGQISSEDPLRDLRVNLQGTISLLRWAAPRAERFLYSSSMSVYGDPVSLPLSEEATPRPLSYYGMNKLASEWYVQKFARADFQPTIFRLFNVYGPGQNLRNMKQGMLSIYMAYVLEGKPLLVKGSKDRFRDFIYIDDVVEAWMAALESPSTFGKIYNLATGRKTHVWEAVSALLEAMGEDPREYPVEYGPPTPDDQFGVVADVSKVSADLEWRPRVDLNEGLRQMANWAKRRRTETPLSASMTN